MNCRDQQDLRQITQMRESDWARARVALDEMIEEAGGIPEENRRWARSVLGLDIVVEETVQTAKQTY